MDSYNCVYPDKKYASSTITYQFKNELNTSSLKRWLGPYVDEHTGITKV